MPPDEIDEIIGRALLTLDTAGGAYIGDEGNGVTLDGDWLYAEIGVAVRAALKAAGFAIVVDEAQALERGREVKLSDDLPTYGQSIPATMETTLDPANPNVRAFWPIDGGKKDPPA